jgi:hypothetical protein
LLDEWRRRLPGTAAPMPEGPAIGFETAPADTAAAAAAMVQFEGLIADMRDRLSPLEQGVNSATGSLLDYTSELAVGRESIKNFGDAMLDVAQIIIRSVLEAGVAKPIEAGVAGIFAGIAGSLAGPAASGRQRR